MLSPKSGNFEKTHTHGFFKATNSTRPSDSCYFDIVFEKLTCAFPPKIALKIMLLPVHKACKWFNLEETNAVIPIHTYVTGGGVGRWEGTKFVALYRSFKFINH